MRSAFFRLSSGLRPVIAIAALVLGPLGNPVAGATTVSGDIAVDTIWEGAVEASGAVTVLENATSYRVR